MTFDYGSNTCPSGQPDFDSIHMLFRCTPMVALLHGIKGAPGQFQRQLALLLTAAGLLYLGLELHIWSARFLQHSYAFQVHTNGCVAPQDIRCTRIVPATARAASHSNGITLFGFGAINLVSQIRTAFICFSGAYQGLRCSMGYKVHQNSFSDSSRCFSQQRDYPIWVWSYTLMKSQHTATITMNLRRFIFSFVWVFSYNA